MTAEGDLLWTPSPEWVARSNLTTYMRWLREKRDLRFADYHQLQRWSVEDLDAFWASIWDYCSVEASTPYTSVLGRREMPGADWFPGAHLNYAQHALRYERPNATALMYLTERTALDSLSWPELGGRVRVLATQLRKLGVQRGDRVGGYLPNTPDAVIAMLATTSIGAIWTSCGPDFGTRGVLDRFTQLAPKCSSASMAISTQASPFDRRDELTRIIAELDSIAARHLPALPARNDAATLRALAFLGRSVQRPEVPESDFDSSRCPSPIRCGSCSPRAPPACRRPSCTATAAYCSSNEGTRFPDGHASRRAAVLLHDHRVDDVEFPGERARRERSRSLYDGNPAYPSPMHYGECGPGSGASMIGANPGYVAHLGEGGHRPQGALRFVAAAIGDAGRIAGDGRVPRMVLRCVKSDIWAGSGSGGTDIAAPASSAGP